MRKLYSRSRKLHYNFSNKQKHLIYPVFQWHKSLYLWLLTLSYSVQGRRVGRCFISDVNGAPPCFCLPQHSKSFVEKETQARDRLPRLRLVSQDGESVHISLSRLVLSIHSHLLRPSLYSQFTEQTNFPLQPPTWHDRCWRIRSGPSVKWIQRLYGTAEDIQTHLTTHQKTPVSVTKSKTLTLKQTYE